MGMPGVERAASRVLRRARLWLGAALLACLLTGCTTLHEYWENGCKVGPNYARPPAAVAERWIDQGDERLRLGPEEHRRWWAAFSDPILDELVCAAFQQNLELKASSFRVLELEAVLGTVIGRLFPQQQFAQGHYIRQALSKEVANREFIPKRFYSDWLFGLGLAWELDLWGKYRRNIEAFQAELDAGIESYDDLLVRVLAEVATAYTEYRTLDAQLAFVRANVKLQQETLTIAQARFRGGLVSELDVDQAGSILQQTLALIPQLEINRRVAQNRLCVLLGIPPLDLRAKLGERPIPAAAPEVVLGVPAELLRRRPDVRKAEREAAARCARIGIAEAEWYPAVTITGQIGYEAQYFPDLFRPTALTGQVGPSFNWKILNYGRIANDVLRAEAIFQQAVLRYQQAVLTANEDVENAVVRFLKAQQRAREQGKAVEAMQKAANIAVAQYKAGLIDFNRVSLIQQNLVEQQITYAAAQGEIAQGLIAVYKALGGGWQIRLDGCGPCAAAPAAPAALPAPPPAAKPDGVPLPTPEEKGKGDAMLGREIELVVPTKLPPRRYPG
jgi:NodT family efflux transporter outer membrane factor (OMF) lipoprotein